MMRFSILAVLLLVQERPEGAFGRGGRAPEDIRVERDLVYGNPEIKAQRLDLYRADAPGKRPAIVFIHGGGWRGGDKGAFGWFCGMLAKNGYVVASVNYRLSGEAKYPAQIEDCQAAVRWVRANAEKHGIDPGRIAAMGGSAGGHLAALVGVKGGEGSRVQAVVSYFGAHDLNDDKDGNQAAPAELIGGPPSEKPELWKDAKCSTHVSADDPPMLFIHGDKDSTVPLSQSEKLAARLREKKVAAEVVVVQGGGHGLGGKVSPTMAEVDRKVLDFLARHLK